VGNARVLVQARRFTEQMQTALSLQAVIDQAVGIVMSHRGATPSHAVVSSKRIGQAGNETLTVLAQQLVDEPG
jgi:AmiR/NasT family two-component response regulator